MVNYRLDVQKSGSAGTLRVYDQTASTGSTLVVDSGRCWSEHGILLVQFFDASRCWTLPLFTQAGRIRVSSLVRSGHMPAKAALGSPGIFLMSSVYLRRLAI